MYKTAWSTWYLTYFLQMQKRDVQLFYWYIYIGKFSLSDDHLCKIQKQNHVTSTVFFHNCVYCHITYPQKCISLSVLFKIGEKSPFYNILDQLVGQHILVLFIPFWFVWVRGGNYTKAGLVFRPQGLLWDKIPLNSIQN